MSNSQLVDSCLLVNRRVEQRQEHSITRTEITQRRIVQQQAPPNGSTTHGAATTTVTQGANSGTIDMQHYKNADSQLQQQQQQQSQHQHQSNHIYSGQPSGGGGQPGGTASALSNGHSLLDHHAALRHHSASPNAVHLQQQQHGHDPGGDPHNNGHPVVSAGGTLQRQQHKQQQQQQQHQQQTTQQVTTVTKVVREVKHHMATTSSSSSATTTGVDGGVGGGVGHGMPGVDYVAMPLDMQHLGPDGQPVDYVAMPLGMYPRSQYINYGHMDAAAAAAAAGQPMYISAAEQQQQQQQYQAAAAQQQQQMAAAGGGHPQYADYEHYPSAGQYANTSVVGGVAQPTYGGSYMGDYGMAPGDLHQQQQQLLQQQQQQQRRAQGQGSPSPSDDHSGSQSPQHLQQQQQLAAGQQPVGYLQALPSGVAGGVGGGYHHHVDELADYRITPSPGGALDAVSVSGGPSSGVVGGHLALGGGGVGHPHGVYSDDPAALVYGYVSSTSPYGTTVTAAQAAQAAAAAAAAAQAGAAGAAAMQATYGTRPIVYDEQMLMNGAGGAGGGRGVMFDNEDELQKHMAALTMHAHGGGGGVGGAGGGGGGGGGHLLGTQSPGSGVAGDPEAQAAAAAAAAAAMRWRDPNLTEVISFLNNPNNVIKANAAAYLQHLCYMDDPNKQRTRTLGGIPPLVKLLAHDGPEVYRNACGALRNLSYGRQNDENKRAIKNAGGIGALIGLLRRTTESDVKELVTGVVWNMSSCEDLKRAIIDDGVAVVVTYIVIPHSGWDRQSPGDTCWSNVFRNASGVLRNVSSAGEYARTKLRDCDGLVEALLYVVRSAIEKSNIGNKIVENCVCILRNLSYRCQEVEDPNYDKLPLPMQTRVAAVAPAKGENLGCFGASKKKKDTAAQQQANSGGASGGSGASGSAGGLAGGGGADSGKEAAGTSSGSRHRNEPMKGYEMLWQPDVVQSYLALLQSCSNPETLEAAAGALQNLAACYWQPSIEIRAAVRKEKGLPILVELLRMEVDRVVCAVATALRNLAIDQRNKELIGKYAMRDLVQKLPSGNAQHDQGTSDDTIAAVLATLNEVIKKNAEFSRSLLDAGGVERLMNITRQRQKYTPRVLKFAGQVLFTMWQHQELRDVYKKHGWKEPDFVTKSVAARNAAPNSPNCANSTLNRPMASQGGTRYEDRTMKRQQQQQQQQGQGGQGQQGQQAGGSGAAAAGARGENNGAVGGGGGGGAAGGPIYQRMDEHLGAGNAAACDVASGGASEPLYAQVNREQKRQHQQRGAAGSMPQQQQRGGGGEGAPPDVGDFMANHSNNNNSY